MNIVIIILALLFFLTAAVYVFMHQPQFGKTPSRQSGDRIQESPNYKNRQFQNLSHTPSLTEGTRMTTVLRDFLFRKSKRSRPAGPLPSRKTDLLHLDPAKDVLIWFGHSSYFLQVDGRKILVDPVFSGAASPVSFTTRSFKGSDVYTTEELPAIDYLFISHDHWDHLDYKTVVSLKSGVGKVITGLGVKDHLVRWGFDPAIITELDWYGEATLDKGFRVRTAPGRHFSGRGFRRNGTLWSSFILNTPSKNLYLGGDSGYDSHFKEIGDKYGPFDLAILECGQYNQYWKYIHMMPEETVLAAQDLKASKLMPVHWGKFSLGLHDWDEPVIRAVKRAGEVGMPAITPMIGEEVDLNDHSFTGSHWWEGLG